MKVLRNQGLPQTLEKFQFLYTWSFFQFFCRQFFLLLSGSHVVMNKVIKWHLFSSKRGIGWKNHHWSHTETLLASEILIFVFPKGVLPPNTNVPIIFYPHGNTDTQTLLIPEYLYPGTLLNPDQFWMVLNCIIHGYSALYLEKK